MCLDPFCFTADSRNRPGVKYDRKIILPQDIIFESLHQHRDKFDQRLPKEYETSSLLKKIYLKFITMLALSKEKMQQHYNKKIRYIDYAIGQKVWLKVKNYKTGKKRKLAPRRDQPSTIEDKLPNGVNFSIENSGKEQKIVHYDRVVPVVSAITHFLYPSLIETITMKLKLNITLILKRDFALEDKLNLVA